MDRKNRHFRTNWIFFFYACNFFSNGFKTYPRGKIGLWGSKKPWKNFWPKIFFLGMGGWGPIFFSLDFQKNRKKSQKNRFFFSRSESHLGCSKCVLGATKWLKTENGGVKCQNSSKNKVWGRKKVNFWPYGKIDFLTPDSIFWRMLTFHTPILSF